MNFSTNQVLHFYVNDATAKSTVNVGTKFPDGSFSLVLTNDGASPAADGKNIILKSDKIENVLWAKKATAKKLRTPYMQATLQFDSTVNGGNPVADQDYIVKVSYPSIGGVGVEAYVTKVASARGASAQEIFETLAKDLNDAFEADGVLKASTDEAKLVITQTSLAVDTFEAGVRPAYVVDFAVNANEIMLDGEYKVWLTKDSFVTKETVIEESEGVVAGISGSFKLADMEYFAMGERGDEYRQLEWPNVIYQSKNYYKIDTAKEYDVITIHYAAVGANANHKMEKDIVIACANGVVPTGLVAAIEALGVTVEE